MDWHRSSLVITRFTDKPALCTIANTRVPFLIELGAVAEPGNGVLSYSPLLVDTPSPHLGPSCLHRLTASATLIMLHWYSQWPLSVVSLLMLHRYSRWSMSKASSLSLLTRRSWCGIEQPPWDAESGLWRWRTGPCNENKSIYGSHLYSCTMILGKVFLGTWRYYKLTIWFLIFLTQSSRRYIV